MTKHIDTLAEWWEDADVEGIVSEGDTIIKKGRAGYDVYTAGSHEDGEDVTTWKYEQDPHTADYRILERAPAPKPAWHDAVAVIAGNGGERQVFTPTVSGMWESEDFMLTPDEMTNPVPLIEQKVADEMVKRLVARWNHVKPGQVMGIDYAHDIERARADLAAALGLDPA